MLQSLGLVSVRQIVRSLNRILSEITYMKADFIAIFDDLHALVSLIQQRLMRRPVLKRVTLYQLRHILELEISYAR